MPDDNPLEQFRKFAGINEAWELRKTGLIVIRDNIYRLELWHSYSDPDIPYYVSVSVSENDVWKRLPDPPFTAAPDGDEAFRRAMLFMSERFAA